ncbi:MAG: hypothetical protein KBS81_02535 [Spirochaetales bacterium]|nr:hypothetical protein [Candidatus Physcosoma equi]
MLVTLQNGSTEMTISTLGAEPQSLVYEGREYIWNGDKEYWFRRAPLLFPMIGPTKDNKIEVKGKVYDMPNNGFARDTEFSLVETGKDYAVFTLEDTEESKAKYYPYGFILKVTYTLLPDGYRASAEITAKDDLWYTFGWHPAFSLDCNGKGTDFESYTVNFEKEECIGKRTPINGVFQYSEPDFLKGDTLDLKREEMDPGAFIFEGLNSKKVTLTSSEGEHGVTVDIGDMPILTLWTCTKHAQYLCIEPMLSFGDSTRPLDIEKMKETKELKKGETVTYENTFKVF